MNGWGAVFLGVAPDGAALPCHAARSLPGLVLPNVKDTPLRKIWYESDAFNRFRGLAWMKEPCRSCDEKERDLGGCRCQAYLLTGDAANAEVLDAMWPMQLVDMPLPVEQGGSYLYWHQAADADPGLRWLRGIIADELGKSG